MPNLVSLVAGGGNRRHGPGATAAAAALRAAERLAEPGGYPPTAPVGGGCGSGTALKTTGDPGQRPAGSGQLPGSQ